jgi:hypothetical protein
MESGMISSMHSRRLALLFLTAACWAAASSLAPASCDPSSGSCENPCSRQANGDDRIWLVSSRCVDCQGGGDSELLQFERRDENGTWKRSTLTEFLADDELPAVRIWIHGNRVDYGESIDAGMAAYHGLTEASRPMKFVIWSWPSDKTRGQIRDVRDKAARSAVDSRYLARLIDRFNPSTPVDLIGYSFGSRIAAGALHLLGGGSIDGEPIERRSTETPRLSAVLMASALDDDWLLPSGEHGRAVAVSRGVLSMFNPCDAALKWYGMLDRCRRPTALGYCGMARELADDEGAVQEMNVSHLVGREHDWRNYLYSGEVMARVRSFLAKP